MCIRDSSRGRPVVVHGLWPDCEAHAANGEQRRRSLPRWPIREGQFWCRWGLKVVASSPSGRPSSSRGVRVTMGA
eukprot:14666538-Alexandrium_andersonii.AAC.1